MKVYFSLFKTSQDKPVIYRKYSGKGEDGKPVFDEVTADYRVTSVDNAVSGSAIKDRSKAGNQVIRLNFGVKTGESTTYFNGTLNMSGNKKSEGSPDMFGTATTKDGGEFDLACWFKQDKNGNRYLSCSMQEPYRDRKSSSTSDETAAAADDDDIPF